MEAVSVQLSGGYSGGFGGVSGIGGFGTIGFETTVWLSWQEAATSGPYSLKYY